MKNLLLLLIPVLSVMPSACSDSAEPASANDIIPLPKSYTPTDDYWKAGKSVSLSIEGVDRTDSIRIANTLTSVIPTIQPSAGDNAEITLRCVTSPSIEKEGYDMSISPDGITVEASTPNGLFYSMVTLGEMIKVGDGTVSCGQISDTPRLSYRGMMLDVSRNFRDTAFIKKQIDAMARLKLNNLHLHLTDGAGWRIEIKRYPQLTDFAAWREGKTWKDWNSSGNRYVNADDPKAEGGFYTQQQLRELVEYAADRYINIIPEIEMPSHSEEVLAAYPELSCTHEQYGQSDYCVGNDSTFTFIENVLTEVLDIFPSKLIHIGGDEASKRAWKDCHLCQQRMRQEKISDVDGLQSYFIKRIEKFLNEHNRDLLGWDEIMEGGIAPNATVMSWRGTEGGEKAAADGHRVIMTPGRYCYLDSYQDAPYTQPEAIGGYLPLELVYSYNPTEGIPEEVSGNIYGLQGNLFAEYIPTAEHAEYMLYPRMYAIAERAWSPATVTDYDNFHQRASRFSADMRKSGYNTFDLENEVGNRPEVKSEDHHLAYGATVEYNRRPWGKYPANGELTLTDGKHGGWSYSDGCWQSFIGSGTERMDVVIDLGSEKDIKSIDADFMQICGPGVFMPAQVIISGGTDRDNLPQLISIDNKVVQDSIVSFKKFGWEGETKARYIRYQATADSILGGVLFTDEIVVK